MNKIIFITLCALAPMVSQAATICENKEVRLTIREAGGRVLSVVAERKDNEQFYLMVPNYGLIEVANFNFNQNIRQKKYRWPKNGSLTSFQGIEAWTIAAAKEIQLTMRWETNGSAGSYSIKDMYYPLQLRRQVSGGKLLCTNSETQRPSDHHLMTENDGDEK